MENYLRCSPACPHETPTCSIVGSAFRILACRLKSAADAPRDHTEMIYSLHFSGRSARAVVRPATSRVARMRTAAGTLDRNDFIAGIVFAF